MNDITLATLAGMISTSLFVVSMIPMLVKAARTRDLKSYSFSHLVLTNVGNLFHWLYVAHLPFGPIWFLHSFHTFVAAAMFICYIRYEGKAMLDAYLVRIRCALQDQMPVVVARPCGQS